MWRWIAGIVAVVILALVGTCYAGYRRLTGGGNTVVAMVPENRARMFTLLTDHDSLLAWLPEGTTIRPERHGVLQAGDTIRVAAPSRSGAPSGRAVQLWIVRDVKAPDVLGIEGIEFDPGGVAHPAFTRRDSLSAVGDSTRVVSTFVGSPLLPGAESTYTGGNDTKAALLNTAERLRLGAARMLWQGQLRQIERRESR
jgi:hypothetical protein